MGPGKLLEMLFKDEAQVVATVIGGDNYASENVERALAEALPLITECRPTLFFAGPAFHAGRYGVACAAIAAAVSERLAIPAVTAMFPENPAVDIYRKKVYIVPTGASAATMKEALEKMTTLGRKLFHGEPIGSAEREGYLARGFVRNELLDQSAAARGVEMLLRKMRNEPFETELSLPQFETIPPAPRITGIGNATIALVSDGGLVPKGNPDHLRMSQNTVFAAYEIEEFVSNPFQVAHSGYHHSEVRKNVNRLLPVDVLKEMAAEGEYGKLLPRFYSTSGNTTTVASSGAMGKGIAEKLKDSGIDAVILTST